MEGFAGDVVCVSFPQHPPALLVASQLHTCMTFTLEKQRGLSILSAVLSSRTGQHSLRSAGPAGDGNKDIGFPALGAAARALNQAAALQRVKFSMRRADFHGPLSLPTELHSVFLQPSVFS